MPYNSQVTRADIQTLIPEDVSREIIESVPQYSVVQQIGNRAPDMPRAVRRMPVLDLLPQAYFVSGDTGFKQTTKMRWGEKFMYVEEIAAIVPIPENVLADSDYDIWGAIKPRLVEAFGVLFDAAVLYGTNKPATWPNGLVPDAVSAGNAVTLSTEVAAGRDIYDAVLGDGGLYSKIENDGFAVTGNLAPMSMKGKLRGLRSGAAGTHGSPLFTQVVGETTTYQFDGVPIAFPRNGALDASQALLIAGDFSELVYAFRSDMTYKMITEGVITDASGTIIYNLPQQDMVALRAVMRLAWQIPNPSNRLNANNATRFPFGVLLP